MQEILDHPNFKAQLKEIAKSEQRLIDVVEQEAEKYLNELHTEQNPIANMVTLKGFDYMMSRAYEDNIDVDPEQLKWLSKLENGHFELK